MKTLRESARCSAALRITFACVLLLMAGCLFSGHGQVPPELAPEIRDKNVMKYLKGRDVALAPELERVPPTDRFFTAITVNEKQKPNRKEYDK